MHDELAIRPASAGASPARNTGFLRTLDANFPDWRLVEIFGPPGAGKTWLCEQLVGIPGILTTANHRGLRYYVHRHQWRMTRALLPYLGKKFAKNYYGHWSHILENEAFGMCRKPERDFLAQVLDLVADVPMPARSRKKMRRSILRSTALTIYSRNEGLRLALDEGFVRRLIDICRRIQAASAPPQQFDRMKACVEQFPFERNAVAVWAPPAVCLARQNSRGLIIASAEQPQATFHEATEIVADMCRRAGWRIISIDNS